MNDKIVVYLRAMEQVDPATFGVFAGKCAQIIADNNEQVKKRGLSKPDKRALATIMGLKPDFLFTDFR